MSKCLYCYKEVASGEDFHRECSLAFFGVENPPKIEYSLKEMSELALEVVERSVSVPGVQPKISMSLIEDNKKDKRLTVVGALGGNYIFKPPSEDYAEMPANEHLTMKMAELFGIEVVTHSLIKLASGELSYITKRIDRNEDGSKIHMIDMFQVVEAFDKYRGSMERIGKAIHEYADNTLLDLLRFYELTVFSFLIGNNDMHLKNFSMIKTSYGWALSPAYDLLNVAIVNPLDKEELALTIAGKKKKITKKILFDFGVGLGLSKKQIEGVFKRFKELQEVAIDLIKISFLSESMQRNYIELIENRYHLFNKTH
ncbi:HipA domain-containing protein [Subsaximicrobium wynnwilliamsii]|uniref:HipA domain-containing protein n=1 Tax=Subsaximicrobium wynnwilliamsii TaxID=291179 RepID=A0A5C6ZK72_9FLAO|nr:HipA domain-containing protein [Subsaximicrobium wynnwilliamsii]TXD84933.1 HipA domain-containing protein [Subsaximicrobium wynnwilliamsii]TXD90604.1 HipA domain-containing protein [Subsaximicrobium wynnwilliamsii]TXE05078.1 HipA domain-containing protein [Subsaximicrobium wynnwilliamsii]